MAECACYDDCACDPCKCMSCSRCGDDCSCCCACAAGVKANPAGKNPKNGAWIVEYTSSDPSQDETVAYDSREEAVAAAADFAGEKAKSELDGIEWEPEDEAPELLQEIVAAAGDGRHDAAVSLWLEYQNEYDPDEKIAIGPSGSVGSGPADFFPRETA